MTPRLLLAALAALLLTALTSPPAHTVQLQDRHDQHVIDLSRDMIRSAQSTTAAEALAYGWAWGENIDVYDATPAGGSWQVAEAVREWDAKSGATLRMTSDPAQANIVVREGLPSDCGTTQAIAGCSYPPPVSGGVAYGTSTVYLMTYSRNDAVGEHIALHEIGHSLGLAHSDERRTVMQTAVDRYDFFTTPQPADYRVMRDLYGRR